MVNHVSDDEHIERTHNIPRFFVEHHAIAWLLMVLVIAWGLFAYSVVPKLKDPTTSARSSGHSGVAWCERNRGGAATHQTDRGRDRTERHGQRDTLRVPPRRSDGQFNAG